ncbi:O-antigen ligase family protein [Shewanella vesiculosa]|uniref:O-antigen ligase family protein n=1 Tax=Shewanella vesiculosa TaxID=518738 RepID=UPI003D03523C
MKIVINKNIYFELGLAFYFCGVIFAWYLQGLGLIPQFFDIGFVFFVSFFLIYTSLFNNKIELLFERFKIYSYIVSFGFFILVIVAFFYSDFKVIIFCLVFYIAYLLFLVIDIRHNKVGLPYAFFSTLLCLFFYIQIDDVGESFSGGRISVSEEIHAYGIIAYCCVFSLCGYASITRNAKEDFSFFIFEVIGILLLILIIILTGVRSPIFGLLFCVFIYAFKSYRARHLIAFSHKLMLLCGFFLLTLYMSSDLLFRLESFYEFLINGVNTFLNTGSGYDDAGLTRVSNREYGFDLFADNILFGAGYKYEWLDFPLLQVFSDMGIFFGISYMLLFFMLPILFSIRNFNTPNVYGFISICYIANMPRLFLHGQPYDWQHLIYVIPVLSFLTINSNKKFIKDNK